MRKGQFFSADFVVATVTIGLALGILLHSNQLLLDNFSQFTRHEANMAEVTAAALAGDPGMPVDFSVFTQSGFNTLCWVNTSFGGSSTTVTWPPAGCAAMVSSCKSNFRETFSATRIYPCGAGTYCVLDVMTCYRPLQ